MEYLNILRERGYAFTNKLFDDALEKGDFELTKWLYENNFPFDRKNVMTLAGKGGSLEAFKYFHELEYPDENGGALLEAAKGGHLEIVKFTFALEKYNDKSYNGPRYRRGFEKGYMFNGIVERAAENGRLGVVDHLLSKGASYNRNWATCAAARNGHLDVLKRMDRKNDMWKGVEAVSSAIKGGHVDVVKYLAENNHYTSGCIKIAIEKGRLDIIQCLVECGTVPVEEDLDEAIETNNLDIVAYLVGKAPQSRNALEKAAKTGNIAIFKLLDEQIFYRRQCVMHAAANDGGNLELVRHLHEKGYPDPYILWGKTTPEIRNFYSRLSEK